MVPMLVLLVLQVPAVVASAIAVDAAVHTELLPVIAAGDALTVMPIVALVPQPDEKVIVTAPADMPVTTPVVGCTVALPVLLLLHVPVGVASVRVVLKPVHTVLEPDIAPAEVRAVTVVVALPQPTLLYVMVAVPLVTPVTTPAELMVATPVLLLLHEPPAVASAKVTVAPVHTLVVPVMAAGVVLTVIFCTAAEPQPVL